MGKIDLPDRQWPSRTIDRVPYWLQCGLTGWKSGPSHSHGGKGETGALPTPLRHWIQTDRNRIPLHRPDRI